MIEFALMLRWLHVSAAVLAVGGAAVMALALAGGERPGGWIAGARRFEWLFWAALGVLVATGIGLLARYGAALPAADTTWGTALALKFALVALIAGVSIIRTMHLARLAFTAQPLRTLGLLYAVTASLGLVVLGLAQVLAHG